MKIKWSGKVIPLALAASAPVAGLKRALQEQTGVEPRRQKILGLKVCKEGVGGTRWEGIGRDGKGWEESVGRGLFGKRKGRIWLHRWDAMSTHALVISLYTRPLF